MNRKCISKRGILKNRGNVVELVSVEWQQYTDKKSGHLLYLLWLKKALRTQIEFSLKIICSMENSILGIYFHLTKSTKNIQKKTLYR